MNEDVEKIVNDLKSRGVFDEFRKECLSAVDTRPAFENLRQKIDFKVKHFLDDLVWAPNLNKQQLRERLRRMLNESDGVLNTIEHLVDQVTSQKATTYMLSRIDKYVQEYLGIKVEEPAVRKEDNVIVWPDNDPTPVVKEEVTKWVQDNWNEVKSEVKSEAKSNPSLSPSTVSSHSLSPPTPEPVTENESEESFPPAPSPTSLISGEDSKSQHYFDETTSKSQENKTTNHVWNQLSKEGKQSADEPKPEPLSWGTSASPPPERPFAHLGSSSANPSGTTDNIATTIKTEPKSPELPSSSSSAPLLSNKSKPESREETSEIEESKGKSDPIVSDMLSDVSSAHTSDLSDFDDPMSISSVEEAVEMKRETDDVEEKVKSEGKVSDIKVKQENDLASQVCVDSQKVRDKDEERNNDENKDKDNDKSNDKANDKANVKANDKANNKAKSKDKDKGNRDEKSKSKEEGKDQQKSGLKVKPKFEVIKSTPETPVFDIRFKEMVVTGSSKKPEEKGNTNKESLKTVIKSEPEETEEASKVKYTIPKIKRETKRESRESSPVRSSSRNEDSKSRRSQNSNNKRKSDLQSSQRYDEADLYKPRYSIPGSRRHRASNN